MDKTLRMTMLAFVLAGIVTTTLPTASALACAAPEPRTDLGDHVAWVCTYYVFGGEAERDVHDTVEFVVETYGELIP